MTPYFTDPWLTLYQGDCRDVLPSLPDASVDCVVTSPPYWGLRDYGNEGQLGLEPNPEQYVANLVAVFRELRRVLKPSGMVWLNLGDTYSVGTMNSKQGPNSWVTHVGNNSAMAGRKPPTGLKPKDLVGIPWRVAFALQADGWYLRSDIIWAKPNPMPESVTDRPTKAHEYVFLLTKSARYFYDADAVREAHARLWNESNGGSWSHGVGDKERVAERGRAGTHSGPYPVPNPDGRNLRSVWTIATRPYRGAHFAVFPPELPERCIKAGCPENGVVLDPFAGSGTVGLVANRLSRRAILIDLNADYIAQQMRRNAQTPLGLGGAAL